MLRAVVPQVAHRPFRVRPTTDVYPCPFLPLARQKPAHTDLLGCSPMRRAVQSAHGFRPSDEERYYVKPHERGSDGAAADQQESLCKARLVLPKQSILPPTPRPRQIDMPQ